MIKKWLNNHFKQVNDILPQYEYFKNQCVGVIENHFKQYLSLKGAITPR